MPTQRAASDERHTKTHALFLGKAHDFNSEIQTASGEQPDQFDSKYHAQNSIEGPRVRHCIQVRPDDQLRRIGRRSRYSIRGYCRRDRPLHSYPPAPSKRAGLSERNASARKERCV